MPAILIALFAPMVALPAEPMVFTSPPPTIVVAAQALTNDIVVIGAEIRPGYAINERITAPEVDLFVITDGLVDSPAAAKAKTEVDVAWQDAERLTRQRSRRR